MGALVNGDALADVPVRIPLSMINRHGLVAGATGTGKTKTLQVLAEQLSAHGVPVFAADIKGDLSGIASLGSGRTPSCSLAPRASVSSWSSPFAHPDRVLHSRRPGTASLSAPPSPVSDRILLSKVLGLNDTQKSSLGLVFHYAETSGLPLLDLCDLRIASSHFLIERRGKTRVRLARRPLRATVGVHPARAHHLRRPGRRCVLRRARDGHLRVPAARRCGRHAARQPARATRASPPSRPSSRPS